MDQGREVSVNGLQKKVKIGKDQVITLSMEEACRLIATRLIWDSPQVPVEERAMRIAQNLGWRV